MEYRIFYCLSEQLGLSVPPYGDCGRVFNIAKIASFYMVTNISVLTHCSLERFEEVLFSNKTNEKNYDVAY
jgi:hypothetical protein